MNLIALAWLAELGLMQFKAATQGRPAAAGGGRLLWPSDLVASFVVFGALSIVAEVSDEWARAGAAFGWVLVLATALNLVDPTLAGAQNEATLTAQATGGQANAQTTSNTSSAPAFGFAGLPTTRTGGGARAQ